ncbi:hypothetical protein LXL04_015729 [Taraxacum kok-saghyz]
MSQILGCLIRYDQDVSSPPQLPLVPFNSQIISLGRSATQLVLHGVIRNKACLDMIESGFPFLESLTLGMTSWMLESFHFRCASIKELSLHTFGRMLIDVQVHAPKLLEFLIVGNTLRSFSFPVSSHKKTTILLSLGLPIDVGFFLKMSEVLMLSCKCYLHITTRSGFDIDMDDLRTRLLLPPGRNVEEVCFLTGWDERQWEPSKFFDAFCEICHPKIVHAMQYLRLGHKNYVSRLMVREVLEKKKKKTNHEVQCVKRKNAGILEVKVKTKTRKSKRPVKNLTKKLMKSEI